MSNAQIIHEARHLYAKCANADAVAYARAARATSPEEQRFWFSVGRYLYRPPAGRLWTDDDAERLRVLTQP
jgi:hypothetical protein